jgi:hypothetical protein
VKKTKEEVPFIYDDEVTLSMVRNKNRIMVNDKDIQIAQDELSKRWSDMMDTAICKYLMRGAVAE